MDESSLRAELERLHRQSFGWAMSCCRRESSRAEDVLQRAYVKVLEGKARFGGTGSFKTWFFAVIRTTAKDEFRRDMFRRLWLVRYQDHVRETTGDDEEEPASSDEQSRRAAFVEILNTLPARQRQVLQLVFYHDLSLSESAAVMGVSLGSARTHYDRAKKAVRKRLQERASHGPRPGTRAVPSIIL